LPESDVDRVVSYAISQGKRSFVGLIPSGAYGALVAAEFKQAVTRGGGRVLAIEHYAGRDKIHEAVKKITEASGHAEAMFIPDGADVVTDMVSALAAAGVKLQPIKLLGTRAWDDPKIFSDALLEGGWYPVPDLAGFRAFAARYRSRYQQDPPHLAALAYDAVTLVAGLAKTSGSHRITDEMLTNPSGFAGIDGRFRFRSDGINQRGLTMMQVTPAGGKVIAPASPAFSVSAK
jgi:ABC-type branched-subunit amino acid transport system substrate-binding protein